MNIERRCGTCRYFFAGECRRFPQFVAKSLDTVPCGEWSWVWVLDKLANRVFRYRDVASVRPYATSGPTSFQWTVVDNHAQKDFSDVANTLDEAFQAAEAQMQRLGLAP